MQWLINQCVSIWHYLIISFHSRGTFLGPSHKQVGLRRCDASFFLVSCLSILFNALLKRFIVSCKLFSGWVFIADNTSHSNNHVNHYLQQIHEHYDAYYVQNDFGHISVLTVWADNCSEQFKSRYQLGWCVLYINKTSLEVIHLFFFCPQHGKGPPDGLGGNCKNAIRAEEKFRRHLPAVLMFICGSSLTSQLFIHQGLGCFPYANVYSDLCPLDWSHDTTLLSPLNSMAFLSSMHLV